MGFLDERYLLGSETAFALYESVKDLPIVDAHNHADVAQLAANKCYDNPWQVLAASDHYVWEMLRKCGVPERLITGDATPKEKWLSMASVFPDVAGNPVYEWVHLDLRRILGADILLGPCTGEVIWNRSVEALSLEFKRPLGLLTSMNIEVMCSTDDPADALTDHAAVNKALGRTLVRPTWRPDKYLNIRSATWRDALAKLESSSGSKFSKLSDLVDALGASHERFAACGCVASDHGVVQPFSGETTKAEADAIFAKGLAGKALDKAEADAFASYMLAVCGELNAKRGWVMQLHMGAVRDIRDSLFKTLGPDSGGDVSDHMVDIVAPLGRFLNKFDGRLKVVLYCLEAGHQASLATIARAFGSNVRLGSAWWLNDTPVGMKSQLEYISSVELLSRFAGMVSDSRKILSYGSRFEMFRRILCDVIGAMVERGRIPRQLGEPLAARVCYHGPKSFFNL